MFSSLRFFKQITTTGVEWSYLGYTLLLLALLLTTPQALHAQCFISRADYAVGRQPQAVVVGEVTGDAFPDIITGDGLSDNSVTVLPGLAGGGFGSARTYPVGGVPRSVVVGEVTGDAFTDIITANPDRGAVTVLPGQAGGGFGPALTYAVGSGPVAVKVVEVTGDNLPDLITANIASDNVTVLPGKGGGGFGPALTYAVGNGPISVVVVEVTGDAIPDIITANNDSEDVTVLPGLAEGGFGTPLTYPIGFNPNSMVVGEVTGDAIPDIITANLFGHNVTVLPGKGGGIFGLPLAYPAGFGPRSVAVGEVTADDFPDIIVTNANTNNVTVLPGQAGGGFGQALTYPVGSGPTSVIVGEVTGDNWPDLIIANVINTVTILMGRVPAGIVHQPVSGSSVCVGALVTASVSTSGPITGYQWYQDGSLLSGQTSATLTIPNSTPTNNGSYKVVITNGCNSVTSTTFNLTVTPIPTVSLTNDGPLSCTKTFVTLSSTASPDLIYQWRGPSGLTSTTSSLTTATPGSYTLVVTRGNSCTAAATTTVEQNLFLAPPSLRTPTGQSALIVPQYSGTLTLLIEGCSGTTAWTGPNGGFGTTTTISVPTTQTGTFVYQASCRLGICTSTPVSATVSVQTARLQLVIASYDCASRQLVLRTTGGNGQPIEYQIPSVTSGWETGSKSFLLESKHIGRDLKLRARQRSSTSGGYVEVEISFTPTACGSARLGTEVVEAPLMVTVLGNPITGQELRVEVRGAVGQPLRLTLITLQGQTIGERLVAQAKAVETQTIPLGSESAGVLLLQVSSTGQSQMVKILKH